jgi:hypothetical protein
MTERSEPSRLPGDCSWDGILNSKVEAALAEIERIETELSVAMTELAEEENTRQETRS